MSLQTAGQASQAQPQPYHDAGHIADPGQATNSPYFTGYNTTFPPHPTSNIASPNAASFTNTALRHEYAYRGGADQKTLYSNVASPNGKYHQAMYPDVAASDRQQQQQNCISAMMSSPIRDSNEQRIRTNSMGQVIFNILPLHLFLLL